MSKETEQCPVQKLVDSFHSLLDESLIYAIANDFDLNDESGYDNAFSILKDLSQSVPSEEASAFDLGALNCFDGDGAAEARDDRVGDSSTSTPTASSGRGSVFQDHRTESSSASQDGPVDPDPGEAFADIFHGQTEDCKFQQLQALFPDVKAFDVRHSLKTAKGDFQSALDDLLNIQYLQSTGQRSKGIDAFFDDEATAGGRKTKWRGRSGGNGSTDKSDGQATPFEDPEEFQHQSEIANLSDWFNISFDEMSALYDRANCSVTGTLLGILESYIARQSCRSPETDEETRKVLVDGLRTKYRSIPDQYLVAIVQTTGAVPFFMDNVGQLANKHFRQNKRQKVDMNYSLKPLPAGDFDQGQGHSAGKKSIGGDWTLVSSKASSSSSSSKGFQNYAQALEKAEACNQARRYATSSAASLYKRGASNPLYRQAASVYAARAGEQAGYAQEAKSTAADLLVEEQSTEDLIDLHGVTVQDGVRIARERAWHWWDTRGKFRGERREIHTFTIITGLGRHNASGVSQLRQCVAKALVQDGWKMEVETGRFVIRGRQ